MTRSEAEVAGRRVLDDWRFWMGDDWRFWMGVAYFGLVLVIVWLFFLNRDVSQQQAATAAAQAERNAEARASAISQRDGCYASADNSPDLLSIMGAIKLNALADSRTFTVQLIDALVPVRDCEQLVLDRFGFIPDIPTPEEES